MSSVSISISKDKPLALEPLFLIKQGLSVNRDGLTVGSELHCTKGGLTYSIIAQRLGYSFKGKLFYSLTDITLAIFGDIDSDPLKLWYTEDNMSVSDYLARLMKEGVDSNE